MASLSLEILNFTFSFSVAETGNGTTYSAIFDVALPF